MTEFQVAPTFNRTCFSNANDRSHAREDLLGWFQISLAVHHVYCLHLHDSHHNLCRSFCWYASFAHPQVVPNRKRVGILSGLAWNIGRNGWPVRNDTGPRYARLASTTGRLSTAPKPWGRILERCLVANALPL